MKTWKLIGCTIDFQINVPGTFINFWYFFWGYALIRQGYVYQILGFDNFSTYLSPLLRFSFKCNRNKSVQTYVRQQIMQYQTQFVKVSLCICFQWEGGGTFIWGGTFINFRTMFRGVRLFGVVRLFGSLQYLDTLLFYKQRFISNGNQDQSKFRKS